MTNEIEQTTMTETYTYTFGSKLQSAREAQGLERKDIAAQLRLNERFIVMLEEGHFATDVPMMFIRGYLRAYSKLLHIPEAEVAQALETMQPKPVVQQLAPVTLSAPTVTSSNYFVQMFTCLIVVTIVGLMGTWWYSHSNTDNQNPQATVAANNQTINLPTNNNADPSTPPPGTKLADASSSATNAAPTVTPPNANAEKPDAKEKSDAKSSASKHERDARDDDDTDETEPNTTN